MTSPVIAVAPDTAVQRAVELLVLHRITGLPVVDDEQRPVGVVSLSDLFDGESGEKERRRDALLHILAGQPLSEDDLAAFRRDLGAVRRFMASPAITVEESVPIDDAAALMSELGIKRVVVTRAGRIAGVVTRADLLRGFAGQAPQPPARQEMPRPAPAAREAPPAPAETAAPAPARRDGAAAPPAPQPDGGMEISASTFRKLAAAHRRAQTDLRKASQLEGRLRQQAEVEELLKAPLPDAEWRGLLMNAERAAAQGEQEYPVMRFPALLCVDNGRAVNLPDPDWPGTLRGKPRLLVERWREELQPRGFRLTARIASFPDGLPGDVEVALVWGAEAG